jgi:hypothetical protein
MYRKAASKSSTAPASLKSHFVNSLTKRAFAAHDAAVLRAAAVDRSSSAVSCINAFLVKSKGMKLKANAQPVTLPLASVGYDGGPLPADSCPRQFYLQSDIESPDVDALATADEPLAPPRCGLTGKFFTKEEVSDNLSMAALEMKFASPFWIRDTHPQLGKFLELRDKSAGIELSVTTSVASLDNVVTIPEVLLHPSVVAGKAPRGANALTGLVPLNKWFAEQGPPLWLTLDQMARHSIAFKSQALQSDVKLVQIEQWLLYNAEQLVVPGRLSLTRSVKGSPVDDDCKVFS